jgi:hypothetical protein
VKSILFKKPVKTDGIMRLIDGYKPDFSRVVEANLFDNMIVECGDGAEEEKASEVFHHLASSMRSGKGNKPGELYRVSSDHLHTSGL